MKKGRGNFDNFGLPKKRVDYEREISHTSNRVWHDPKGKSKSQLQTFSVVSRSKLT